MNLTMVCERLVGGGGLDLCVGSDGIVAANARAPELWLFDSRLNGTSIRGAWNRFGHLGGASFGHQRVAFESDGALLLVDFSGKVILRRPHVAILGALGVYIDEQHSLVLSVNWTNGRATIDANQLLDGAQAWSVDAPFRGGGRNARFVRSIGDQVAIVWSETDYTGWSAMFDVPSRRSRDPIRFAIDEVAPRGRLAIGSTGSEASETTATLIDLGTAQEMRTIHSASSGDPAARIYDAPCFLDDETVMLLAGVGSTPNSTRFGLHDVQRGTTSWTTIETRLGFVNAVRRLSNDELLFRHVRRLNDNRVESRLAVWRLVR